MFKDKHMIKKIMRFSIVAITSIFLLNVAHAKLKLPRFDCALSDKINEDDSVNAKNTFTKTTPQIYYVCTSEDVVKGQSVKAIWIAEDTNHAAPPNYKIDEKAIEVTDDLTEGNYWTGKFSLIIPDKGWPLGKYHVDLYVNDALSQSATFTIQ